MGSHIKSFQGKLRKGKMWKLLICVCLWTIVCDGVPHHKTAKTFNIFSGDSTTENHEETTTMGPDETTTEDSDLSFFADWPLFCTALWYPYDSEKCKSARCMPCAESIRASAQLCKQSEGMVSWRCPSRNVGVGFCNHCLGEVRVAKTFGLFSEDSKSARCMPCAESIRSTAQVCQQTEGSASPR